MTFFYGLENLMTFFEFGKKNAKDILLLPKFYHSFAEYGCHDDVSIIQLLSLKMNDWLVLAELIKSYLKLFTRRSIDKNWRIISYFSLETCYDPSSELPQLRQFR